VVTLSGNTFIGRQGETILKNMGMDDWVTYSEKEYIDLVVKKVKLIMGDKQYKKKIREKIETSPVMDTTRFAGHLCEAFQVMWKDYCNKKMV
jgi:predicted O-linked N-acetylglucosamine transferase (SPINDLY family)